jgi:hypothetical protein
VNGVYALRDLNMELEARGTTKAVQQHNWHAIGRPALLIADVGAVAFDCRDFLPTFAIVPPQKRRENWKCQQRG